eukprot:TRINITY_DN21747_c2_g1_i1.p1 TRINITY_DN21747_c2_g1~~TRINITY_DN21747_c2_g1_i1.p1  ORF type:complete len:226 (+),score=86.89 TRINITY_DN21747_c2_g1_i1:229-906(+)
MGEAGGERASKQPNLKVVLLGDSAVGKSKLVERFLMGKFCPQQQSTHGLRLLGSYDAEVEGEPEKVVVDFWDTAGQERFNTMHSGYYHEAMAAILVFDVRRKPTYKNLETWFSELRQMRPEIPVLVAANKIDLDMDVTKKEFNFAKKHSLKLHYVSAATGMNVVQMFEHAIAEAVRYKNDDNKSDFTQQVLDLLHEGIADSDDEKFPADDAEEVAGGEEAAPPAS